MTVLETITRELADIAEKVRAGQRLSCEDGVRLYATRDIHTLGELANMARERLHGRKAFYNINRHINYTNYCVLRCKFCSFYRPYSKEPRSEKPPVQEMRAYDACESESAMVDKPAEARLGYQGKRVEFLIPEPPPEGGGKRRPAEAGPPAPDPSATIAQPGNQTSSARAELPLLEVAPLRSDGGYSLTRAELPSAGSASLRSDGGYALSIDEIVGRAREADAGGATEVHIVGGLHPTLPFEYYVDMCRAIRQACPRMHIKAFTAIEIIHFARISRPRLSIREVLERLREAGLGSLPGGGAEIFDDRVHEEAYKNKIGEQGWFDVHAAAHELGIFSNATMLYGHIERPEERVRHLMKLRAHQDVSLASRQAHFNCIIPLSFIPDGSALSHLPGPTGLDDLRTLAVSRLMLDNIPHVKAFWIMQTPKLAQVSLNWGVDDLDGTVVYYDITKREGGGTTHQEMAVDAIKRLISEAGCVAVERDTLYRPVRRDDP